LVEFGVLGPLFVVDDRPTARVVGSGKARLLLAVLLCRSNTAVSSDMLVEALWGGDPPRSAAESVRVYVHQVRGVVGEQRVRRVASGYQLLVRAGEVDRDRFRDLSERARKVVTDGDPVRAGELFRRALALWRGSAFGEFHDVELIRAAAVPLDESRLDVLEERFAAELAAGRHAELCAELRALCAQHPLRENLRAQLMLALVRSGRQAEATAVFHDTRRQLADEYGLDPGPQLLHLHQQILVNDPGLSVVWPATTAQPWTEAPREQVTPRCERVTPSQLPGDTVDFCGRVELLAALDARLPVDGPNGGAVVVTVISGMAGVGKTTLAVHWAHRVASRFPDGQLFVSLRGFAPGTPVRPIDALASLLRGLGLVPEAVPLEVEEAAALYRSMLAGRRVLVVLDNAGSAEQVRPLLPGEGGCLVVVTSRYRLSGLAVHDGARRLTVDVLPAQEARRLLVGLLGAERVAGQQPAIDELVRVCGYLPLALRIAAAQLVDAPFRGLAEQAALLRGGGLRSMSVDGDDHAAVRVAFDASYESMPAQVRRMFRLLGLVSTVDVSAPAAAALAGLPVDEAIGLLDRLMAGCLLDQPAAGRYAFHDLLRWYAAERAAEDDPPAVREEAFQRFCDWYLFSVEDAARHLYGHSVRLPLPSRAAPPAAMRFDSSAAARLWLEAERPNLVALIGHCAQHGPRPTAWLLADALRGFFGRLRHIVDWTTVVDAGLSAARQDDDRRAIAAMLHSAAYASYTMCRYSATVTYLSEAADLARGAGWDVGESAIIGNLGVVQGELGQTVSGAQLIKRRLRMAERLGHFDPIANNLNSLSHIQLQMGQLNKAVRGAQWALTLATRDRNISCLEATHGTLGNAYWELGMPVRAARHFHLALELSRTSGHREAEILSGGSLALIEATLGPRPGNGLRRAESGLANAREIADHRDEAAAINALAAVQCQLHEYHEARRHYQLGLSVATAIGAKPHAVQALLGLATVHHRLGDLDQAQANAERALAEATTSVMAVRTGQAHATLAEIELDRGNRDTATDHARRALRSTRHTGHRPGQAHALAILATATPNPEQARRLWTAAKMLYAAMGLPPHERLPAIGRH
jgi:DNA-binding SARP family transcriptional activator/tetratricopeptide (TPR) repeat protein